LISFGALSDLVVNSKALDINKALQISLSRDDIKQFIINMNTDEQLFDDGIDSTGRELSSIGGDYAPSTILRKIDDDLPFDHITLYQTGDFYKTFTVHVGKDSFTIEADTMKDGQDLQDSWGDNILGLTDDNIRYLILELLPLIREYILNTLLK
jgi:hypothetical protein